MKQQKERKVERHYHLRNLAADVYGQAPRKWRPGLLEELRDELNTILIEREKERGQV